MYAGIPAGWTPPARLVAHARFTYSGVSYLPGAEIDAHDWPSIDVYRLVKQRRLRPAVAVAKTRPRQKGMPR